MSSVVTTVTTNLVVTVVTTNLVVTAVTTNINRNKDVVLSETKNSRVLCLVWKQKQKMRCTEVHLIRLLHSKENEDWGLRIEVYMRCTIFTLFKTWKLENEVHIREPPVLIITIRLSSWSRSLPFSSAWYNRSLFSPPLCTGFPFSSTRTLSARPSSPPTAHPSDPPA